MFYRICSRTLKNFPKFIIKCMTQRSLHCSFQVQLVEVVAQKKNCKIFLNRFMNRFMYTWTSNRHIWWAGWEGGPTYMLSRVRRRRIPTDCSSTVCRKRGTETRNSLSGSLRPPLPKFVPRSHESQREYILMDVGVMRDYHLKRRNLNTLHGLGCVGKHTVILFLVVTTQKETLVLYLVRRRRNHCLLWIDKERVKEKTNIWVSVWWKTKNSSWGIYTSHIQCLNKVPRRIQPGVGVCCKKK